MIISVLYLQMCLETVKNEKAPMVSLVFQFIWFISLVGAGGSAVYNYTGCILHNSRGSIQTNSTVSSTPLGLCSMQPAKPIPWSLGKITSSYLTHKTLS